MKQWPTTRWPPTFSVGASSSYGAHRRRRRMLFGSHLGSFIAVGFIAKRVLDKTMRRSGETLEEIHHQAGPNRGKRTVFLLGVWRSED
jgi:hypothetical protein